MDDIEGTLIDVYEKAKVLMAYYSPFVKGKCKFCGCKELEDHVADCPWDKLEKSVNEIVEVTDD